MEPAYLAGQLNEEGIMVTLEYARAYVDELQRVANRPRAAAAPSSWRRLMGRIHR